MAPVMVESNFLAGQIAVASVAVVVTAIVLLMVRRRRRLAKLRRKWNSVDRDVVVLHQLPRSFTCPNPSPFPLKLETFLRICGIKYVCDFDAAMGPKGLTPWITLNGEDTADSQLALERLAKFFGKDLMAGLSPTDRATGRALRVMIEERTRWCIALDKWVYMGTGHTDEWFPLLGIKMKWVRCVIFKMISRKVKKNCCAHGVGRHSQDDVEAMGVNDLEALSNFLGTKKQFLLGDQPTEVDCSLFGMLCNILHCTHPDSVYRKAILERFTNLHEHFQRMKSKYWEDWDECINKKPY